MTNEDKIAAACDRVTFEATALLGFWYALVGNGITDDDVSERLMEPYIDAVNRAADDRKAVVAAAQSAARAYNARRASIRAWHDEEAALGLL